MKKNNSLYLLLLLFNCAFAQKFNKKNIYFSIDAKEKWEIYNTKKDALFLGNHPMHLLNAWDDFSKYEGMTYNFSVGYGFNEKYFIELGYTASEIHWGGFQLPHFQQNSCPSEHLYYVDIETGVNYSLRGGVNLGKKKLKLLLSSAYIFSVSNDYRYSSFPFDQIYSTDIKDSDGTQRILTYQASDERFVDYALRQYYHSVNGNIGVAYQFSRFASINYNIGYTHGFNTLAYYNVKYKLTGYPEQHAINEVKGSNYYYSFGLTFYPFRVKKKKK